MEAQNDKTLTREQAQSAIRELFGDLDEFLKLPESGSTAAAAHETKFREKARSWIVNCWGTGEKSDLERIAEKLRTLATADLSHYEGQSGSALASHLLTLLQATEKGDLLSSIYKAIGWKGRPSQGKLAIEKVYAMPVLTSDTISTMQAKLAAEADEKMEKIKKGARNVPKWAETLRARVEKATGLPFVCGRNLTDEYSVMLDLALRRVSSAHSWQKRAEANRQKLAEQAQKQVPTDVEQWLDEFLEERGRLTGAVGPLQIQPRAVESWEEIVKAWSARDCRTAEDRKAAARELQDEIEKFGDITLFEALSAEGASIVWLRNGRPDPQPLLDYVNARDAQAKMRRFKVPAYRHPHPLSHPVFCDYGKSRWAISFAVHKAANSCLKAVLKVDGLKQSLAYCGETTGEKMPTQLLRAQKQLEKARARFRAALSDRRLTLRTVTGSSLGRTAMLWQSKRLVADLMLEQAPDGVRVSRADRLSRAAAGIGSETAVLVLNVFVEKDWNGRLQAPRAQLDRLARRVQKHGWDAKAVKMRNGLNWFITFSGRLQTQEAGPWATLARRLNLDEDPQAWPHAEDNKGRKGHATLMLCRIPGLSCAITGPRPPLRGSLCGLGDPYRRADDPPLRRGRAKAAETR